MSKYVLLPVLLLFLVFQSNNVYAGTGGLSANTPSNDMLCELNSELCVTTTTGIYATVGNRISTNKSQATSNTFTPRLYLGASGKHVEIFQKQLVALGYLTEDSVTGYYGILTEAAIKRFQIDHNLEPVGYVGPRTEKLLSDALAFDTKNRSQIIQSRNIQTSSKSTIALLMKRIEALQKQLSVLKAAEKEKKSVKKRTGGGSSSRGSNSDGTDTGLTPFQWKTSAWSACVSGRQAREVSCVGSSGQDIAEHLCSVSKPETTQTCEVSNIKSCTFGGKKIPSGSKITAYQSNVVPYGSMCKSEQRICIDGVLSGFYTHTACKMATQPVNGTLPSVTVSPLPGTTTHPVNVTLFANSEKIYYTTNTSNPTCTGVGILYTTPIVITKTTMLKSVACSNSGISGPVNKSLYVISEPVVAKKTCTLDGVTISHGSTTRTYNRSEAPYGTSCQSQVRTCTDGTLSGSYAYNSCSRVIKVMTYNIHHGEGTDGVFDLERIGSLVKKLGVDVVGIQEVDKLAARTAYTDMPLKLSQLTGMEYRFGKTIPLGTGEYGNLILSRYPIKSASNIQLPNVAPNEQRALLKSVITVDNKDVTFMTTHLSFANDSTERLQSIATIKNQIETSASKAAIVVGDLNAKPSSDAIAAAKLFLADAWEVSGSGNGYTVPPSVPTKRIDYVLYTPSAYKALTSNVITDASTYSDHLPVVADIIIK